MFDTMGGSAWLGGGVGRAGWEEALGQRKEHLNHFVACPGFSFSYFITGII